VNNQERYSRQVLFAPIGAEGQQRLQTRHVVVCGCGALGSVLASSLVRAGVAGVRIVDRDFVETSNLQRQILFDEQDVAEALPKAEAAARKLRQINSQVDVEAIVADVDRTNVLDLYEGADLVVDGTDNFEVRFLLNEAAVKTGKPWVYGACVGSQGLVMAVVPGRTPCLRCVFESAPAPGMTATCDTAGILAPTVMTVASLQFAEALKILTGNLDALHGQLLALDVWEPSFRPLNVTALAEDGCATCRDADYPYLDGKQGARTQRLCGRHAVQLTHRVGREIQLQELAGRLKPIGTVVFNDFLLRFEVDGMELTVFSDGRAIVKGTEDETAAKALYAKYVGH